MITQEQRALIAQEIGLEISKHRKFSKISQKELADHLGMKTPQLCKIENGKNLPGEEVLMKIEYALGMNRCSLAELRNYLIEAYEDPIDDTVTSEAPRLIPVGPKISATEDELDKLSFEVMSTLNDYYDLEEELGIPHFCRIHLGKIDAETMQDGISLADDVRFRLDIGNAPLHTNLPILEQFNIRIVFVPTLPPIRTNAGHEKARAALAFFDRTTKSPVICVSDSVSPESQLYHIAYELGDYFQSRHMQRKHRILEGDGSTFSRAFASTFLMPTTAIRDLIDLLHIENDKWSPTLLYEVARRFGVSTQALIWRLDSIHRIDKKLFEHYKKNPPKGPYEPAARLPHDVWLNTLRSRAGKPKPEEEDGNERSQETKNAARP